MENLPELGNVLTCGSEDKQRHEQAHNGEYGCQSTPIAILTVGESRIEHIQCEWCRRLPWPAPRQSQDADEHLECAIDAEDQRRGTKLSSSGVLP